MNDMNGENKMGDGFSTNDAVLWGAMNNMGRGGGYGGGGWGNGGFGFGGHGTFAGPGSNAVRIDNIGQKVEDQADCTRSLFGQAFSSIQGAFENQTRANEFNRVCEKLSDNDTRNTDGQFRAELRAADRADMIAVNAKLDKLNDCCCDQRVESAQAETRNVERYCDLKAGQARIETKLEHNKEVQALETKLAAAEQFKQWYCCPPPVRCVDPCRPS